MGRIVGIDLGTTYSAVAIPEERAGDGFQAVAGCPGVSIIVDRKGRRITPSVVAEGSDGQLLVGYEAKSRAGASPPPIMFAKRAMGENVSFTLGKQGTLRPEEVSARILGYLKTLAEERLGEPVEEAVITVPAYFGTLAKQMTEKAGELAGLRVAQVAPEPVAAALMYCAGDPRPDLRIMTYDLGGGTFDVAVLEKRDGVISTSSILSYDGDRHLGGFNFDRKLALWFAKRYGLELDFKDAADRVPLAKLMVLAEQAKLALSKEEEVMMVEQATGISDRHGTTLAIDLTLRRADFEALIRDEIETTIVLCRRALEEKGDKPIAPDSLDEILMVGGSSRIPLVARRLEEAFGRKPRLVEPDLCVALGAAILAGTKPKSVGRLRLHPIPAETDLQTISVTGQLLAAPDLPSVAGCPVTLRSADGSCALRRTTDGSGGFQFDRVELADGEDMAFVLNATSPAGKELAQHRFSVRRTDNPRGLGIEQTQIRNTLAKPIGIVTKNGIEVIAPERTPLPYETQEPLLARTTSTSGQIRIPIVEESSVLGEILMRDLPAGLEVGTEVQVFLSLQENHQILGRARIPSVNREAKVVIEIPMPVRKTHEQLQRELETLNERADEALKLAGAGAKFGDGRAARLKTQLAAAATMIKANEEPARIEECLDDIGNIVRELGKGWRPEPPRALFDRVVREARELLQRAVKEKPHVAQEGHEGLIDAIVAEADAAYTSQNGPAWKERFASITAERDKLQALFEEGGGGGGKAPKPAELLLMMSKRLEELQKWAHGQGRYKDLKAEFDRVAAALKAIDPNKPDALNRIVDWHDTDYGTLRDQLMAPADPRDDLVEILKKGGKQIEPRKP